MWFWWFIFFIDLLVPVAMLIGGYFLVYHPPKHIQKGYGYRTSRSMTNEETWKFANRRCGQIWMKSGAYMLAASVIVQLPFFGRGDGIVGAMSCVLTAAQCIVMLSTIYFVERDLKRTFDKDGNRI